jgi:predicted AlkP superfamily phosphohydrolase/phosphomutase
MTYPAEEDPNVLMITGIPTPDLRRPEATNPPDLFERFQLDKGRYRITLRLPEYEGRYGELITELKQMVKERLRVAEVLIREPWDLFMVHFYATDVVQHALWKFMDTDHPQYHEQLAVRFGNGLYEVFSEVDRAIGELLKRVDPKHTTILIMSDHGFGSNHCTVHINRWLKEIGMLKLVPLLTHLGCEGSKALFSRAGLTPQGSLGRLLIRLASFPGHFLPATWQDSISYSLKHFFPHSPRWSSLFNLRGYPRIFERIDWKRTRAYSIGTSGLIYINLRGREPEGAVFPGQEYEEVRETIAKRLIDLTDAHGRRLFDHVYRKEQIYHGKYLDDAPDLIPLSETVGCYFYPFLDREGIVTEAESFRSGNHRIEGILIAKGPFIKRNKKMGTVNITDLAPTILYALGVPLPRDIDGSVAQEIFEPEFLSEHPVQQGEISESVALDQTLSSDDEIQMAKKLEDLGYL